MILTSCAVSNQKFLCAQPKIVLWLPLCFFWCQILFLFSVDVLVIDLNTRSYGLMKYFWPFFYPFSKIVYFRSFCVISLTGKCFGRYLLILVLASIIRPCLNYLVAWFDDFNSWFPFWTMWLRFMFVEGKSQILDIVEYIVHKSSKRSVDRYFSKFRKADRELFQSSRKLQSLIKLKPWVFTGKYD